MDQFLFFHRSRKRLYHSRVRYFYGAVETGEACRILGLEGLDAAMDRTRLQKAFHRRLFQIHPDMQAPPPREEIDESAPESISEASGTSLPIDSSGPREESGGSGSPGKFPGADQASGARGFPVLESPPITVDSLIEARKTLLLRLESRDWAANPVTSGSAASRTDESPAGTERVSSSATDPWGKDGYNLYRRALFLYSEAILAYFERKKRLQGEDAGSAAETDGFRDGLEEARGLFVQVLERFPGGIWTPDSIEQIARINVWLKSNGSRGG